MLAARRAEERLYGGIDRVESLTRPFMGGRVEFLKAGRVWPIFVLLAVGVAGTIAGIAVTASGHLVAGLVLTPAACLLDLIAGYMYGRLKRQRYYEVRYHDVHSSYPEAMRRRSP